MNAVQQHHTMIDLTLRPLTHTLASPTSLCTPSGARVHLVGNSHRAGREVVDNIENANVADDTPEAIIQQETEAVVRQDQDADSGSEEENGGGSSGDEEGEDSESDEEMKSDSESEDEDGRKADRAHKVNSYTLGELLDDHNLCGCNVGHGGKSSMCTCCGDYLELIYEYTKAMENWEEHDTMARIDPQDDAMLYYHSKVGRICECRLPNGEIPRVEWQIYLDTHNYWRGLLDNVEGEDFLEQYDDEWDWVLEHLVNTQNSSSYTIEDLSASCI
ncbi:hypothetical protein BU16DRAFT_607632 [Lophium mytilinum]|uniref:Uncharacterized protein n=1 Tax=Lophium mytilinum TaxID=390894 RepID=A0A6A6QXH9_9PEZI|nr:hypothetical protein BU16DRAFT_607632 [Lophium mytilinum]